MEFGIIWHIHPPSKGYHFVLVTIDYFTRWTKVVLLKNMTHKEVIEFIIEHTINIFSLPHTLSIDQGTLLFQRKCENLPTNVKKIAQFISILHSKQWSCQV